MSVIVQHPSDLRDKARVTTGIPKRIIQTGKNLDLPVSAKAAVANVKLLNPDFEYVFFDDAQVEKFINREFPEYRQVFDSFQFPIQRYDFFRYLAVYRHGGFYFDLDVYLSESLSSLLQFDCVFPFEELSLNFFLRTHHAMDWEIGNYAFAAAPGHPFLKAVIENCVKAQKEPAWVEPMMCGIPRLFQGDFLVLNTTGPGLVTRTLAENPALAQSVKVLFPDNVCDEKKWHHFGNFGVHLPTGSWRKRTGFLRARLARFWEASARRRLLKESLKLGKIRQQVAEGRLQQA